MQDTDKSGKITFRCVRQAHVSAERNMFGYITICKPELKIKDFERYKAFYCGLCQELKEKYGMGGQMTLTYDMTFLVVLLSSLYEFQTEEESTGAGSTRQRNRGCCGIPRLPTRRT